MLSDQYLQFVKHLTTMAAINKYLGQVLQQFDHWGRKVSEARQSESVFFLMTPGSDISRLCSHWSSSYMFMIYVSLWHKKGGFHAKKESLIESKAWIFLPWMTSPRQSQNFPAADNLLVKVDIQMKVTTAAFHKQFNSENHLFRNRRRNRMGSRNVIKKTINKLFPIFLLKNKEEAELCFVFNIFFSPRQVATAAGEKMTFYKSVRNYICGNYHRGF